MPEQPAATKRPEDLTLEDIDKMSVSEWETLAPTAEKRAEILARAKNRERNGLASLPSRQL
jgi:hypothetical protein